jgi:hypothetical protein
MSAEAPRAPLSVYMLADHLDAALAAGEDLVVRGQDWQALAEAASAETAGVESAGVDALNAFEHRQIAEEVRGFELMLIARILKAREHARALAGVDPRFAAVANLFVSGTALLVDAIDECGDARNEDFESGDGVVAYVRSRGLIAPDASNVRSPEQLLIDDSFLVARRMTLGPLMDMSATFLDVLDTYYDLFVDAPDESITASPAARAEFGRRERMPVN